MRHRHSFFQSTRIQTADCKFSFVIVVRQIHRQHLKRLRNINNRSRDIFNNLIEQRLNRGHLGKIRLKASLALHARSIHHRKIRLLITGAQLNEKIKGLIQSPLGTRTRLINFIYHHDGFVAGLNRFPQYELGLRHRTFFRVHDQQYAVYHAHNSLYLAAKIGVTRGVYDINFQILITYRGVFRQNSNTALTLQFIRVHD